MASSQEAPGSLIPTGGVSGWGAHPVDPKRTVIDDSGTVWLLPAPPPSDLPPVASADSADAAQPGGAQDSPAAPGASGGSVDPREVAVEVLHETPLPNIQVRMNPDTGLVALPAWYWVEAYDGAPIVSSRAVDLPPLVGDDVPVSAVAAGDPRRRGRSYTVEVTIRPIRYDWNFGDGATMVSRTLGQRYPRESEVRHTYEHSSLGTAGGFPVRLTVSFSAEFRVDGGPPQPLPPTQRTYGAAYRVQEIQSVLVSR
jgi:hypothetical protein